MWARPSVLLVLALLWGLEGPAEGARLLKQLLETHTVRPNPAYLPTVASTIDGFGGHAAALSNPNSAGVYVQSGTISSAGDMFPGPTGRVAALNPDVSGGGAAVQSGMGELPIISTGNMAAASQSGSNGVVTAVAAPDSFWVGAGSRATATSDATGLYGGSKAISYSGDLRGPHLRRDDFGEAISRRYPVADSGGRRVTRNNIDPLNAAGWGWNPYYSGSGSGSQTSFAGPQTFESVSYGASGIGGPVAVAAAGEAVAVSQSGTMGRRHAWIDRRRRLQLQLRRR